MQAMPQIFARATIIITMLCVGFSSINFAQKRSTAISPPQRPAPARRTFWVSPPATPAVLQNREAITALVEQVKRAGFDAIILYVKELNGHVIYPSRIAPRLTEYKGVRYPTDFDPLQIFIEEAHKRNLRLHAGFETFTEGNKAFPGVGVGYTTHKDWQTVAYDVDAADRKIKRAAWGDFKQGIPLFVNAALPAVQDYELSIVKEVLDRYTVDAVVLDRARWQGINADFSDYSRARFAGYVNDPQLRWPEDVYEIKLGEGGKKRIVEGKHYRKWLEWRAGVIHDYFVRLHDLVRRTRPRVALEDYVGSWYPEYNEVGVNWASNRHKVPYSWATPDYHKTGYAQLLDVLYVGLYYPRVTEAEAVAKGSSAWRSIEGAAKLAREVTMGDTTVYGVINYGDDALPDAELERATRVAAKELGGVSIFEASHVARRHKWDFLTNFLPTDFSKLAETKK